MTSVRYRSASARKLRRCWCGCVAQCMGVNSGASWRPPVLQTAARSSTDNVSVKPAQLERVYLVWPTTPSSLCAQRASQHCRIPWPSVAKRLSAKASDHARRFRFFRRKTNASVHCWQMLASGLSCSRDCFSTCWRLLLSVSASFWRAWLSHRAFAASPNCCCPAQRHP